MIQEQNSERGGGNTAAGWRKQIEELQAKLAMAVATCPFLAGRFYSVLEVANVLGVSRKTVWKWGKEGALPPIHGACRRFRGDQLVAWTEAGRPWREIA